MTDQPTPPGGGSAFVRKHRMALAIGAILLVLAAASGEDEPVDHPFAGGDQPMARDGGGWSPTTGGDTGGDVDMDAWRRKNDADDRQQRDRIDAIRDVERCTDQATGETREVSIHVGC